MNNQKVVLKYDIPEFPNLETSFNLDHPEEILCPAIFVDPGSDHKWVPIAFEKSTELFYGYLFPEKTLDYFHLIDIIEMGGIPIIDWKPETLDVIFKMFN